MKTSTATGYVGVDGLVKLLHGPYTDEASGRWWVVRILADTALPNDKGKEGWMAEVDSDLPNEVNLVPASCQ